MLSLDMCVCSVYPVNLDLLVGLFQYTHLCRVRNVFWGYFSIKLNVFIMSQKSFIHVYKIVLTYS